MEHSRIGGSSTHRFIHCPGSVRMCKDIKSESSTAAEEGSAAHFVAENAILRGLKETKGLPPKARNDKEEKLVKRFEQYFCEEMYDHVDGYLAMVRSEALKHIRTITRVEQRVDLSWLHPEMFGTADISLDSPDKVTIIDLKYGVGLVEIENNPAMMFYALGVLTSIFKLGTDKAEEIPETHETEMIIHQPRGFHTEGVTRRWTMKSKDLVTWGLNVLKPAAVKAMSEHAPCIAGPWCQKTFCDALHNGSCDEAFHETKEIAKADFDKVEPVPVDSLTPSQLSRIVEIGPAVIGYIKAAEKLACSRSAAGENIPGYKAVMSVGRREWKSGAKDTLLLLYGEENIYAPAAKRKMKSPAQLEKSVDYSEIKALWEKPEKGLTLVVDTDPREAHNQTVEAKKDFEDV